LTPYRETLEASFCEQPPHTVAEAVERIEQLTGVRRGPTQVHQFLRETLELSWQRTAAVPCPPKKNVAEHVQTQANFLKTALEPGWPKRGPVGGRCSSAMRRTSC